MYKKFWPISFSFILLSSVLFASDTTEFEKEAQAILGPIKKAFMGELTEGMKKGAYDAVEMCHLKVPHIAEANFNEKYEYGRTSSKIRNPNNEPKEWLKPILAEYEKSTEQKPLAPKVILVENRKAYVEPIYIKGMCLQCHGSLQGSVEKKIKNLYPKDQATGFKLGEFRGLFWLIERK
jgi:hypothetical protein